MSENSENSMKSLWVVMIVGVVICGILLGILFVVLQLPDLPSQAEAEQKILEAYPDCAGKNRVEVRVSAGVSFQRSWATTNQVYYLVCDEHDLSVRFKP